MIQFTKALPTDKVLWAFNNNILRFKDPEVENPTHCNLNTTYFNTVLYPDPDGFFRFNFMEYVKAVIVKDNFLDKIALSISSNVNSLLHNDTNQVYLELVTTMTVVSDSEIGTPTEKTFKFLSGVLQLEDVKKGYTYQESLFALQIVNVATRNTYRINYWPGYPMDVAIYTPTEGMLNLKNLTNEIAINIPVPAANKVSRLALCDAIHDETIEDFLPLSFGYNLVQVTKSSLTGPSTDIPMYLDIKKHDPRCGIYVKFRNNLGGWTYWLFHQNHLRTRSVKEGEDLNNDFNDINDTVSPSVYLGAEASQDSIKGWADHLSAEDVRVIEQILESPKIYLYTGERYTSGKSTPSLQNAGTIDPVSWIEIKCSTKKLDITQPKRHKYSFAIDFALPARNRVSLL